MAASNWKQRLLVLKTLKGRFTNDGPQPNDAISIEITVEEALVFKSERDVAIEKLAQLTRIMQQLVAGDVDKELHGQVHTALGLKTEAQRGQASAFVMCSLARV